MVEAKALVAAAQQEAGQVVAPGREAREAKALVEEERPGVGAGVIDGGAGSGSSAGSSA